MKAIQEIPVPKTEKEVRGFLGRLNYVARFILHLTANAIIDDNEVLDLVMDVN